MPIRQKDIRFTSQCLFFNYFSGIKTVTRTFARHRSVQFNKEGPMTSRQWKGIVKPSRAQHYINHLRGETFPSLKNIPGFVSASILQRTVPAGEEFLIVTVWESIEAIKRFAGENPEVAVVPANVQTMMVEYEKVARHYAITETYTDR